MGQVVVQQRLDQVKLLLDLQLRVDVGQWQAVETIHSEGRLNSHWATFKQVVDQYWSKVCGVIFEISR